MTIKQRREALVVSLLLLVCFLCGGGSSSSSAVEAAPTPLNFLVSLSTPAGLSATFSPRRIVVKLDVYLTSTSTMTGKADVWLPTNEYNIAKIVGLYPTAWSNVGTYFSATNHFSIKLQCSVETIAGAEDDAFKALANVYVKFPGASPRAYIREIISTMWFEKLAIVHTDNTARKLNVAKKFCQDAGGFLSTMLKPYEQTMVLNSMTTSVQYWQGALANDERPNAKPTRFCYITDPDYRSSACTNPGYFAFGEAAYPSNGAVCPRLSGFPCMGQSYDFDSMGASTSLQFVDRIRHTGSLWDTLDRLVSDSNQYGHVCTKLNVYGSKNPAATFSINGSTPTLSVSKKTRTFTVSESASTTVTKSANTGTETKSRSVSRTGPSLSRPTPSDETPSIPATASPTLAPTPSRTISGITESFTMSRTPERTPTRTFSRSRPTSRSIPSLSESMSNESTPSLDATFSETVPLTPSNQHTASVTKKLTVSDFPSATEAHTDSAPARSTSATLAATGTATVHIIVVPEPALPVDTVTSTVAAIAIFSGAGVVASQQARLNTAKALIKCGEGNFDEEPDRISSPFKFSIGKAPHNWSRGMLVGNVAAMCACALLIAIIAFLYAKWKNETFATGLLRLRMPGILIVPALVFLPPSATASTLLFWWGGRGGADYLYDMMLSIAGVTCLVFIPVVYCGALGWVCSTKGKVKIVFEDPDNPVPDEFAESNPNCASSCFYRAFVYLAMPEFEFEDQTPEELEEFREEQRNNKNKSPSSGDGADKIELGNNNNNNNTSFGRKPIKQQMAKSNDLSNKKGKSDGVSWFEDNEFTARHGVVWEDFSQFGSMATLDIIVAALMGLSAGTASGVVSVPVCLVCFSVDFLACLVHLLMLLWYLKIPCVTPRFVKVYMIVASFIQLVAVCLSFAMWLGRLKQSGSTGLIYVGLVQGGLGGMAGIIGLFDLVVQLWDAVRVKKRRPEANFMFTLDDDILVDLEEELANIDIEAELAALPEGDEEEPPGVDLDAMLLAELGEGGKEGEEADADIDLDLLLVDDGADASGEADMEIEIEEPQQTDLNHLLEDDDENEVDPNYDPYKLDDGDDDSAFEGGMLDEGGIAGASRGNAEMLQRQAELATALGNEDDSFSSSSSPSSPSSMRRKPSNLSRQKKFEKI